jgi:hypothetical protein
MNKAIMLLNLARCLSILLLQTDNNALDIDAIYNLKFRKIRNLIQQAAFHGLPLCQNNVNAF